MLDIAGDVKQFSVRFLHVAHFVKRFHPMDPVQEVVRRQRNRFGPKRPRFGIVPVDCADLRQIRIDARLVGIARL